MFRDWQYLGTFVVWRTSGMAKHVLLQIHIQCACMCVCMYVVSIQNHAVFKLHTQYLATQNCAWFVIDDHLCFVMLYPGPTMHLKDDEVFVMILVPIIHPSVWKLIEDLQRFWRRLEKTTKEEVMEKIGEYKALGLRHFPGTFQVLG